MCVNTRPPSGSAWKTTGTRSRQARPPPLCPAAAVRAAARPRSFRPRDSAKLPGRGCSDCHADQVPGLPFLCTPQENGTPPHDNGAAELQLDRAGERHAQAGTHDAAPPTSWAPPADAAAAAAVAAGSRGPLVRIVTSGSTRAGSPVPSAGVCQRAAKAPPRWVSPLCAIYAYCGLYPAACCVCPHD